MAGCDGWAVFKTFEVILCLACLIYKWWTDEEASRLFFYLEKASREWPLLKNITWNRPGSWFAAITYGSYVIITIGLLIAHVVDELRHTRKTETFLLGIGALLFFGAGCMVVASFDNVPESLVDNAFILGLLSILTGVIFLIDIGCFKRREYSDKTDKQEKEFRMKRDKNNAIKFKKDTSVISEKSQSKQNGIKKSNGNKDVTQEKMITELRSSIKKKKDKEMNGELQYQIENEKVQTTENVSHERSQKVTKQKQSVDEHDNVYDYDEQSIKNYDEEKQTFHSDGEDSVDLGIPHRHYDRKSRGSQTSRKHFQNTIPNKELKDAGTSTESPKILKSNIVNYAIQSSAVSSTNPQKSDTPSSEEGYELQPPASSSYLISNGKKFQATITPSRIERLTQNAQAINSETGVAPASPQDPGYVLHTVSKWPNTTPLAPQPYKKWKEETIIKSVHSVV